MKYLLRMKEWTRKHKVVLNVDEEHIVVYTL